MQARQAHRKQKDEGAKAHVLNNSQSVPFWMPELLASKCALCLEDSLLHLA